MEALNKSGIKLIKDMIIVPINNTLLYIEPVYQTNLNEKDSIPVLKKVIVASGNTVAIGNNLEEALNNLFDDDSAVDLEFVDVYNIEALVDSVIKANNDLNQSLESQDFEMIGKDITRLQNLVKQLETARQKELELREKLENNTEKEITNESEINNSISNEILDNSVIEESVDITKNKVIQNQI